MRFFRLRVARGGRGYFDDRIRQLPHRAHKHFHNSPVKLGVGATFQFGKRFQRTASFFVGPVARDGVIRVRHGDNARTQRNAFPGERVRVPGAVEEFVMM